MLPICEAASGALRPVPSSPEQETSWPSRASPARDEDGWGAGAHGLKGEDKKAGLIHPGKEQAEEAAVCCLSLPNGGLKMLLGDMWWRLKSLQGTSEWMWEIKSQGEQWGAGTGCPEEAASRVCSYSKLSYRKPSASWSNCRQHCFEQEAGLETSRGPFWPQLPTVLLSNEVRCNYGGVHGRQHWSFTVESWAWKWVPSHNKSCLLGKLSAGL